MSLGALISQAMQSAPVQTAANGADYGGADPNTPGQLFQPQSAPFDPTAGAMGGYQQGPTGQMILPPASAQMSDPNAGSATQPDTSGNNPIGDSSGGNPDNNDDPLNLGELLRQYQKSGQESAQAHAVLGSLMPKPNVSAQSRYGTGDIVKGLLPLAAMLAFGGKKGQQLAAGFIPGFAGGKEKEAQLQNVNQQQQFQGQLAALQAVAQSKQQQAQFDAQNYQMALQAHRYEMMYGNGSAKWIAQSNNGLQQTVKSGGPEERMAAATQLRDNAQKYGIGIPYTDAQIAAFGQPKPGESLSKSRSADVDADAILKQKKAVGQDLANKLHIQLDPITVTGAGLRNGKLQSEVNKINEQVKEMPQRLAAYKQMAQGRFNMDEAHSNLYAATASFVGPKALADIDKAHATIARYQDMSDIDLAKLNQGDKKIATSNLNAGLGSLNKEMNTTQRLVDEITKSGEYLNEDDPKGPAHQLAMTYENRLKTLQDHLTDTRTDAERLRKGMGLNSDGSPQSYSQKKLQDIINARNAKPSITQGQSSTPGGRKFIVHPPAPPQ